MVSKNGEIKMNEELKKAVDSVIDLENFSMDEFFHEGFEYLLDEYKDTLPKGLTMKDVYSVGGYEGGGDECSFVVDVKIDDKHLGFVMFDGWYASYDGVNFEGNDYKEVKPFEFTETRYK